MLFNYLYCFFSVVFHQFLKCFLLNFVVCKLSISLLKNFLCFAYVSWLSCLCLSNIFLPPCFFVGKISWTLLDFFYAIILRPFSLAVSIFPSPETFFYIFHLLLICTSRICFQLLFFRHLYYFSTTFVTCNRFLNRIILFWFLILVGSVND